jgi:predicted GNAT family acetyltransferase
MPTTTLTQPIMNRPTTLGKGPNVPDFSALDHPIWGALSSVHGPLARSTGAARRYSSDVSPLAALREPTEAAFSDLATLVNQDDTVALFTTAPVKVPSGWQLVRERLIDQMICTEPPRLESQEIQRLGIVDIPEMLTLTAATQPGPFLNNTIAMGRYFGIRSNDGRLAAMTGERLKLHHFTEISAVCTDPEHRGQGHGRALVAHVARLVFDEGKTPFLHVKSENGAKVLYEKLGFRTRREIQLTVISRC